MKLLKKGAMFGLDARIALAIFGALSVISGAALYSAIQDSKVTAVVTELDEIGKSFEAYLLDTGDYLTRMANVNTDLNFYVFKIRDIVEKPAGVKNWSGPYLSYEAYDDMSLKYTDSPDVIHMFWLDSDAALGNNIGWSTETCIAGKACALWLTINGLPESIIKGIDEKVDDADGITSGRVRLHYYNSKSSLYYKYMPLHNPNT